MRKIIPAILLLALLFSGCTAILPPVDVPETDGTLHVHFVDVGQADSILLTTGTEAMLIDAGNNEDGEMVAAYLRSHGISHLKYAVGTHPHEDHIGGLDTVLNTFGVDHLLMPRVQTNTKTFEDVLDAALAQGLTITAPQAGDTFSLGDAVITAVNDYTGDDLNNASIMLRLSYGSTSFLFTADAEAEAEQAAIATGLPLRSDVLKVGHHGSSTSTSTAFLAAVSPAHAVISCGTGNDYGHPHRETIAALNADGCRLFRTDQQGTVVAATDGSTITWSTGSLPAENPQEGDYILNTSSMKFHLPTCSGAASISEKNKRSSTLSPGQLLQQGYAPCGTCKP